jgi:pimeloyl-ACP methyl ester carboxylesterase
MSDTMPGPDLHNPDLAPEVGRLGPNEGAVGLIAEHWPRVDDGLQIRGGGAVAVDTATLSAAAVRFDAAREDLTRIAERLRTLRAELATLPEHTADARASASVLAAKLEGVQVEADEIAAALREAGYAYEMVEIEAEHRAAVLAGDTARARRLDARMTALADAHPDAWRMALGAQFERAVMWPSELVRQATQWGVTVGGEVSDPGSIVVGAAAGLLTLGGAAGLGLAGTGRLSRDARLSGTAGPVTVTSVAPASPRSAGPPVTPALGVGSASSTRSPASVAPRSLAAVTERMPGAGDSRVRVERYSMPDGSRQYAVYIAGMQSFDLGGREPWDNASNVELYTGKTSDSYAATQAALAQAGVEPGDTVHMFGFSQGAMIAGHLALEGGYDTQTLVSIGSPVDTDVGSETLSVTLRHTDDPVAGLAGGGHGAAVGAPGSFIAERVFDPEVGTDEPRLPAHRLNAYAETAALVDASSDPRVGALRDVFADLARAESVQVTEYAATRGAG